MHSAPVASQEGQETAEGGDPVSSYGLVKKAIVARLEERYPDRVIPWGDLTSASEGFEYHYFAEVAREWRDAQSIRNKVSLGEHRKFIEREIAEKYPCMEVPRGIAAEWARELGVSRQRVHQLINRSGAKSFTKKNQRTCIDCNNQPLPGRRRCSEHIDVLLTCDSCGKEFRLSRPEVFARMKQSQDQTEKPGTKRGAGKMVLALCRKDCRKRVGVDYLRKHPQADGFAVADKFGVSRAAVYQWERAIREEQSRRKRL